MLKNLVEYIQISKRNSIINSAIPAVENLFKKRTKIDFILGIVKSNDKNSVDIYCCERDSGFLFKGVFNVNNKTFVIFKYGNSKPDDFEYFILSERIKFERFFIQINKEDFDRYNKDKTYEEPYIRI